MLRISNWNWEAIFTLKAKEYSFEEVQHWSDFNRIKDHCKGPERLVCDHHKHSDFCFFPFCWPWASKSEFLAAVTLQFCLGQQEENVSDMEQSQVEI